MQIKYGNNVHKNQCMHVTRSAGLLNTYLYTHMYMCVCVCACVCMYICTTRCTRVCKIISPDHRITCIHISMYMHTHNSISSIYEFSASSFGRTNIPHPPKEGESTQGGGKRGGGERERERACPWARSKAREAKRNLKVPSVSTSAFMYS